MKSLSLDKPRAIIMVGIPGSGKTYFASKFANTFSAPYIDESALYKFAKNDEAAIGLVEIMVEQTTRTKNTIVLEVDSGSRSQRTALARALKAVGYEPLFVWVQVDDATAKIRASKTAKKTTSEYMDARQKFSAPHSQENALVISGKHTYATQAKIVLRKLTGTREVPLKPASRPTPSRGNIIVR